MTKKICWNFRKGRCRFGSKCTFAHDSDVKQRSSQQTDSNPESSGQSMAAPRHSFNMPLFKIPLPRSRNDTSSKIPEDYDDNEHDFDSSDAVIECDKK